MLAKHRSRFFGLAGLIAGAALALPAGAGASTVTVNAGTLTVNALQGEINQVSVEQTASNFRILDDTAPLTTTDPDCVQVNDHFVRCPTAAGVTLVSVLARDQNDTVTLFGSTPGNLDGGQGFDTLTGGTGGDQLFAGRSGVGFGSDFVSGGDGADTLHGPTNAASSQPQLVGGNGADTLLGGPGSEFLDGGADNDNMFGGDGTDVVDYGSSGAGVTVTLNDVANDGIAAENDNVHSDVENIIGSAFPDALSGSALPNSISGSNGNDVIQTGDGDDSIDGGNDDDTLNGGAGADFMSGGFDFTGADTYIGGTGIDEVSFSDHFGAPLTITIDNAANDGAAGESDNVKTDVENLDGSQEADVITGSTLDNRIEGFNGNDQIKGSDGDDVLFGDTQFGGSPSTDTLRGEGGDDLLTGGPGPDTMIGNSGFDAADYSNIGNPMTITVNDVANDGQSGENDNVTSTVESVFGGTANDVIAGNSLPNVLMGGGGADTLNGAGGDDLLDGEIPNFFSFQGGDAFIGGRGVDTVSYASHSSNVIADNDGVADDGTNGTEGDNVQGDVENLFGGQGSDTLTTVGAAANVLDGGPGFGSDTLNGGDGPDILSGGFGFDTLNGEAGNDKLHSRGDNSTDTDNCGINSDIVEADAFDTVNPDCETVFNP